MRKNNKIYLFVGLFIIIGIYVYIFNKPVHGGFDFIKERLTDVKIEKSEEITKNNLDKTLNSEYGFDFDFKNSKSYLVSNKDVMFVILEYKNDIEATNLRNQFGDYLQDKSKEKQDVNLEPKDMKNFKTNLNSIKTNLEKANNLRQNFDFNGNSNFIIIKIKGTTQNLDQVVRKLH